MKKLNLTKKQIATIVTFIIGLAVLITGLVFLILRFTKGSAMADGEYLVSATNWTLENENGVIWDFTEIGKGTLTTNDHKNDYDFIWSLEDGELKIETKWLYDMENDYEYTLDQNSGILTLRDDENEYRFIANF